MKNENYIVIQGWMVNELSLKGNDLLVYALIYGFSQDGESVFNAGRNYIAETFNISLPTVDKVLNNLIEDGLIEKIPFEVNNVTFNSYKISLGVVKNLGRVGKESWPNNIINNKKQKDISKDISTKKSFEFGKPQSLKQSFYSKCINLIDDFCSRSNYIQYREKLIEYLNVRLEIKDKPLYFNSWKGILNKLDLMIQDGQNAIKIINQSIEKGYLTFYPVTEFKKATHTDNATCYQYTDQELEELRKLDEERERNGIRTRF